MASIANIHADLVLRTAQFNKALKDAKSETKRFGRDLAAVGKAVIGVSQQMAKYAGIAGGAIALIVRQSALAATQQQRMADRMQISTQRLQELQATARMYNIDQDKMVDGLKDLSEKIADAAANGGGYDETLQRIGLMSSRLVNLPIDQQFEAVAAAIAKLPTAGDKAFAAMELMSDGGYELLSVMDGGAEAIRKAADDARAFGYVLSSDAQAKLVAFGEKFAQLELVIAGAGNSLAVEFAPMLTDAINYVVEWSRETNGFRTVWADVASSTRQSLPYIVEGMKAIGIALAAWAGYRSAAAITSTFAAIKAGGAAVQALSGYLRGATTAQVALNTAMKANPLGLVLGLISAGVTAWSMYGSSVDDAADSTRRLKQATDDMANAQARLTRAKLLDDNQGQISAMQEQLRALDEQADAAIAATEAARKYRDTMRDVYRDRMDEIRRAGGRDRPLGRRLAALRSRAMQARDDYLLTKREQDSLIADIKAQRADIQAQIDALQSPGGADGGGRSFVGDGLADQREYYRQWLADQEQAQRDQEQAQRDHVQRMQQLDQELYRIGMDSLTPEQRVMSESASRMAAIERAAQTELAQKYDINELLISEERRLARELQAIDDQAAQERLAAMQREQQLQLQRIGNYAALLGNLQAISSQFSGASREAFYANQAISAAAAGVNAWLAWSQVMADSTIQPTALKTGIASATLAAGFAAVGQILAQRPPERANGGTVYSDGIFRGGERGAEPMLLRDGRQYIIPPEDGQVYPNSSMRPGGHTTVQVHVHNNADGTKARAEQSADGSRIDVIIDAVDAAIGSRIARRHGAISHALQARGMSASQGLLQ